jgi:tetratricopeptide (TPR) repeat protein
MVAKALKAREAHEQLQTVLESVDASQLSTTSSGPYQSAQSQWVNLALDAVKHLFAATDLTEQRILRAERLLTQMQRIDKNGGLSRDTPNINTNGQSRKLPSQKQRFVLQYTKFLQELGRFDELAKQCKAAIDAGLFYRNSNLKWILYRLALALKDSNPQEALKACDDFVALEERSYSLLLRAEILLACGDKQGALREAAHSLQKVLEKDVRFVSKNLRFVAALTDDLEVKKLHVQMVRFVRYEQGQRPHAELENEARELDLPPASEAPSFDALRAMWDQINPNTERRRTIGRAVPKSGSKETHPLQAASFMRDQSRLGEVIMAKIPTKSGEEKYRPVVVIGQNENQLLVGPLQASSKHRKAVDVSDWAEAGLKQSSVFVPFWHIVPNASQKVLGKLSANDKSKITSVI